MSTKGIRAEQKVARDLKALGYLPATRRHMGGAGDLLLADPRGKEDLLVEVKNTAGGPYAGFSPEDRKLMRATAFHYDIEPILAWVTPLGIAYIPEDEWPQ